MISILKRTLRAGSLLWAFPAAAACGFGRIEILFTLFAHAFAIVPGFLGDFVRAAFYSMTLEQCPLNVVIAFGTFFSRRQVILGPNVSIGAFCVIGPVRIGARSQISSHVEIPGGRRQHVRNSQGRLSDTVFEPGGLLSIGEDCWIGASAVVMANVGSQSTIGAGSVVVRDIPDGVVAVGSPARPIKSSIAVADQ